MQQEKRLNSKKGTKSGMGCAISKLMQRLFQEFEIRGFHFRSEELPAEIWSLSSTAIPTRCRSLSEDNEGGSAARRSFMQEDWQADS
jgi:hypothetical protein